MHLNYSLMLLMKGPPSMLGPRALHHVNPVTKVVYSSVVDWCWCHNYLLNASLMCILRNENQLCRSIWLPVGLMFIILTRTYRLLEQKTTISSICTNYIFDSYTIASEKLVYVKNYDRTQCFSRTTNARLYIVIYYIIITTKYIFRIIKVYPSLFDTFVSKVMQF